MREPDAMLAAAVPSIPTQVLNRCARPTAAHAHAAVLHGATPTEAPEAIGVTFLMNGGPATVYGARAFAAFREFHAELAEHLDGQRAAAR